MSTLTTLRGTLIKQNNKFITVDGKVITYIPVKNFTYDSGDVFAFFEVCANTYILWQTVPVTE